MTRSTCLYPAKKSTKDKKTAERRVEKKQTAYKEAHINSHS